MSAIAQTETKAIWFDGNGITCVPHAGAELSTRIEANPRKKTHNTFYGHAYLLDQTEIEALQAIAPNRELCETCEYLAKKKGA